MLTCSASALLVMVALCPSMAGAATIYVPGPGGVIDLLPNTPNQTFFIDVSGGELSIATNVNVQIGDGPAVVGGFVPFGGTDGNKPVLTDVRVTTPGQGLIFASLVPNTNIPNNNGEPSIANRVISPYLGQTGTSINVDPDGDPDTTDQVSVALTGHLAQVTVSTVGFPALPADQLFAVTPRIFSGPGIVPPIDVRSQVFDGSDPDGPGPLRPSGDLLPVAIVGGYLRIPGTAVPEPGTAVLAGVGAVILAVVTGRRRGRNARQSLLPDLRDTD